MVGQPFVLAPACLCFILALGHLVPAIAQTSSSAPPHRVLEVGPTRAFNTPSAASQVAHDGDHIKIDAGEYTDCAVWRANNLVIEAIGGTAHMSGVTCADQAIWLVAGNRTLIKGIVFSGAHSRANNGAGIKLIGSTMTVQDSKFDHNENGILIGPGERSYVLVVHSTFTGNGKCEPECAHGIYAGHIAQLRVLNCTFSHQNVGHHIKSRAAATEIVGNRIEDGSDGTASFSIDLPNGGTALIRQNYIQKGEKSENRLAMVSIGEEGGLLPSKGILIERNSFLNARPQLDAFIRNMAPDTPVRIAADNTFLGDGLKYKVVKRAPSPSSR